MQIRCCANHRVMISGVVAVRICTHEMTTNKMIREEKVYGVGGVVYSMNDCQMCSIIQLGITILINEQQYVRLENSSYNNVFQ